MSEIDLTLLPAPKAVEEFDFETVFARRKQRLLELCPENIRAAVAATLALESEPLTIDLQQQAYQEILLRQRINEAAAAGMLAFAAGADLDHLGALRGVKRKTLRAADPAAEPPVEALYETDADFRRRIQQHPETYAAAGPKAAYEAHAVAAHADVAEASALRIAPGSVRVYIKSHSGNGVPSSAVIAAVSAALSAETVRPLCDSVEVQAARPKTAAVSYEAAYFAGPDKALIKVEQTRRLQELFANNGGIGGFIAASKIIAALHVEGVKKVRLAAPAADIQAAAGEFIALGAVTAAEAAS